MASDMLNVLLSSENVFAGDEPEGGLSLKGPDYPELEKQIFEATLYLGKVRSQLVMSAYHFANYFHQEHEPRKSGEPYIEHPVAVALILAKFRADVHCIVAALLHDVYEDHGDRVSLHDINRYFGREVATMVDGLTKISQVSSQHRQQLRQQIEQGLGAKSELDKSSHSGNSGESWELDRLEQEKKARKIATVRKLVRAMAQDIRVILIKLADRLHNMRTLAGHSKVSSQQRISKETLDIFVPIAARLGIWCIKSELEDIAFKYLYPREFAELEQAVTPMRLQRRVFLEKCACELREIFAANGMLANVEIRNRHLYGVYQIQQIEHCALDSLHIDYLQIIIPSTASAGDEQALFKDNVRCYEAMAFVHNSYTMVPSSMRDYIGNPKSNKYQALHTSVICDSDGHTVEIQICHQRQDNVNRFGILAGFFDRIYDDKHLDDGSGIRNYEEFRPWLSALLACADEDKNDVDYLGDLSDALANEVLAFTPAGTPIDLPNGSNPIDFAYRVHTELGDRCVGALVNGEQVSLKDYKIQPHDVVTIQSTRSASPQRDWYEACQTNLAKNRIRAWFAKGSVESNIEAGQSIATAELIRSNLLTLRSDENFLRNVAKRLNQKSVNEMLASLGCWQLKRELFAEAVRVEARRGFFAKRPVVGCDGKRHLIDMVRVLGDTTGQYRMCWMHCCSVVPGDNLVGFVAHNKEIRVHRDNCRTAADLKVRYPDRFVALEWERDTESLAQLALERNRVCVLVHCRARAHMIGDIIAQFDVGQEHVSEFHYREDGAGKNAEVRIYFRATDVAQVDEFVTRLAVVNDVIQAERI